MDLAQLGLSLEAQPMLTGLEKVDAALAATAAKAEALAGKIKSATASMAASLKNMGGGGGGATAAMAGYEQATKRQQAILKQFTSESIQADRDRSVATQAIQRQLVSQAAEAEKEQLAAHRARLEQQSAIDKAYAAQQAARIQQATRAIVTGGLSGKSAADSASVFAAPGGPAAGPAFTQSGIASVDTMRQKMAELRAEETRLTEGLKAQVITHQEYARGMMGVTNGIKVLEEGSTRARGAFRQMTAAIASATFEITGAVYGIVSLGAILASPAIFGMKLQSNIEQTRLAMAGVIISMGEINGKSIELPEAMRLAALMTDRMVASAVKYGLELEVIQDSVKAITSSGLGAKLQLPQILEVATQMAVIGKNMAIPSQRLAVDIRDIMTGMNVQRTVLGGALGITNAMVKKWRESGTLFANLSEHIKGFAETLNQHANTLAGRWDQIKTKAQLAFSNPAAFDALKVKLKELSDFVGKIDPITGKFVVSPEALALVNSYWLSLKEVWVNLKAIGNVVSAISPLLKALGGTFELVSFALRNLSIIIGTVVQGLAALLTGNLDAISRIGAEAKVAFKDNLSDLREYMNLLRGSRSELDTLRSALATVPQQKGLMPGFGNVPSYDPLALVKGKPQAPTSPKTKADPYENVYNSVSKLFTELTKLQTEQKALASGDYTSIAQIEAVKKVSDLLEGLKNKTKAAFEARLAKDFAGQFAAAGIAGGTLESRLVQLITREGQLTEKIRLQNEERRKSKEEFQRIPGDIGKVNTAMSALDQAISDAEARMSGKEESNLERSQKAVKKIRDGLMLDIAANSQIPEDVVNRLIDAADEKIEKLTALLAKGDAFLNAKQSFSDVKAIVGTGRDVIQSQVNMGLINEVEARQKLRDMYKEQTGTLQTLIPVMQQQLDVLNDQHPTELTAIMDLKLKQAELEAYIQSVKEMVSLGKEQTAMEGMLRGLNDYIGSAADKFTNARDVMTKALSGVEDALVTLATTGKLSFKSMADGIVADVDRMIIKSQLMPAITDFLGLTIGGKPNANSGILGAIGSVIGGSGSQPDGSSPFKALYVQDVSKGATGILGTAGATGGSGGGLGGIFGSIGNWVSGLFSGPATASAAVTAAAGGANLGFLPSFAVGSDYVPRDMVAKIHRGEKIVPAAQNNGSNGGGTNVSVVTHVTVAGNTDTRTANQIGIEVGRHVQAAMRRNG